MSSAIEGLKPAELWKHFADLSRIPRGSRNEKAAAAFVIAHARRLGLEWAQDAVGNVVVRKPAHPGRERAPMVCLQGHLDMVCEKRPDVKHDFEKDPIRLVRDGDLMMADGTTLGADNGVAVATFLALMEDGGLAHGPLEFLFTIDEETGLTGAQGLEPGFLKSGTLLNLDSEEEGALYIGCSGGRDTTGAWPLATEAAPAGTAALEVTVGGLRGGHSGMEIDKGRGNAIKLLARAVERVAARGGRLVRLDGGNKRNAIPRDATALLMVPRARLEAACADVAAFDAIARAELATVEPDLRVTATASKARGRVFARALQKKLLRTLQALPHGVHKMSADIPGLVETSTNVAVLTTARKAVTIGTSQRSSVASEIDDMVATVAAVMTLGGAEVTCGDGYPGWKPDLDSRVLAVAKRTYAALTGREPEVKAIHAGLECGIIGEKYPGMDMVSFGPTLEGVHSPDEKIHIGSVERYWDYLRELLKAV